MGGVLFPGGFFESSDVIKKQLQSDDCANNGY